MLGTSLVIDDQPHTIVGVLSPGFTVPFLDAQVFTPLVASPEPQPRAPPRTVVGLAELAPGASIEQARDELAAIYGQLAQEFPRTHACWTHRRGRRARVAVRVDAGAAADAAGRHGASCCSSRA